MNKIVRENYPASNLPEDLRGTLPPGVTVRVTVEMEADRPRKSFSQIKKEIDEARHRVGNWPQTSAEEAVARIRALRDEWM